MGCPGRCNDSQIFEKSALKKLLDNPILAENKRIISGVPVPVVILGDSAFRFAENVMKPYPFNITADPTEKNFNYSLSKCRRVVENAFGHLKARFRRIGKGIDNKITNAAAIIKCCCVLHNFLNANNCDINEKWQWQQRQYEQHSGREQPGEVSDSFTDFNPRAEEIRRAIASFLSKKITKFNYYVLYFFSKAQLARFVRYDCHLPFAKEWHFALVPLLACHFEFQEFFDRNH